MCEKRRHIIIGTSGHIDHGKSSIVKILTGTDPDRFQEEKDRGMTIDLGYAFYSDQVAFIDVPGHERFIKNMVSVVTTIDFVMFVIAADDGVMPQTREHLDILRVLDISRGLIVLNKIDLVEPDWIDLVEEDVRELVKDTFLQGAPVVRVSSVTEAGFDELRQEIDLLVQEATGRRDCGYFWLPIDRSFSIQGFGTVVTGSVLSGELKVGEEVELLPVRKRIKVRGLQRHGKKSDNVLLGDRAAVNLPGIHRDKISRGDVLATPGLGMVTKRLDVQLQLLSSSPRPIKDQDRLRLHVGTSEIFTRVRLLDCRELFPGRSGFVQLMLDKEIAVSRRDRFVIRRYSPSVTIGGGVILDNSPLERHHRFDDDVIRHFQYMLTEDPETIIHEYLQNCLRPKGDLEISRASSLTVEKTREYLNNLHQKGKIHRFQAGSRINYMADSEWQRLQEKVLKLVDRFHRKNPHLSGMSRAELSSQLLKRTDPAVFDALIDSLNSRNLLSVKNDIITKAGFSAEITEKQEQFYRELTGYLQSTNFTPPTVKEIYQQFEDQKKQLDVLIPYGKSRGELIVFSGGLVYLQKIMHEMQEKIRVFLTEKGSITAADFRDMIQASRKYAVAVLEYLDETGFTRREGDDRVLGNGKK